MHNPGVMSRTPKRFTEHEKGRVEISYGRSGSAGEPCPESRISYVATAVATDRESKLHTRLFHFKGLTVYKKK